MQNVDTELQTIVNQPTTTSLKLKLFTIPLTKNQLYCDVSTNEVRPFIPKSHRFEIFSKMHNLAHPDGIKATTRLICDRFVWPKFNDILN